METTTTPHLTDLQKKILGYFEAHRTRGLTSEELQDRYFGFGVKESTVRTRISELVAKNLLRDRGVTRPSSTGRRMTVWLVV